MPKHVKNGKSKNTSKRQGRSLTKVVLIRKKNKGLFDVGFKNEGAPQRMFKFFSLLSFLLYIVTVISVHHNSDLS